MNKRTRALDVKTYEKIIRTIREGFWYQGVHRKPNERVAVILQLEFNLGIRISDILRLRVDSFVRDGGRYRLDLREKKTGKYRGFTVPAEVYGFVREYADAHYIHPRAKLFPVTERAVQKHLHLACEFLGLEGIGTHSFRKGFATNVYVNSNYDIELVRTLLQHSSVSVTQRYIGIGSHALEEAIRKNVHLV